MASVATSLVVTRYWPAAVPAPAVSPADRTGKGTGRAGGGKAEVDKTAPAAAVSAPLTALMNQTVTCVEGILSELPGFVSKSNHNGLFGDLTKLDAAAHAIESDGETAATLKVYGAALDQAIKRAGQIAGRSSETPDSIDAAQGVEARLNDLKNQLP